MWDQKEKSKQRIQALLDDRHCTAYKSEFANSSIFLCRLISWQLATTATVPDDVMWMCNGCDNISIASSTGENELTDWTRNHVEVLLFALQHHTDTHRFSWCLLTLHLSTWTILFIQSVRDSVVSWFIWFTHCAHPIFSTPLLTCRDKVSSNHNVICNLMHPPYGTSGQLISIFITIVVTSECWSLG